LRTGHVLDALNLCEKSLQNLAGDPASEAVPLRMQVGTVLVQAYCAVGRFDAASALCQEALAAARPLRMTKPNEAAKMSAIAYHGLGYICRRQANNMQARLYFERAVALARDAGAQNEEADALLQLSLVMREVGDFAGSDQNGQLALGVAQETGNDYLAASVLQRLALNNYYRNDFGLALARTEQAAALQRQMGDAGGIVLCEGLKALIFARTGEVEQAIVAVQRARQESSLLENPWLRGQVLYIVGVVHILAARYPVAEEALREALGTDDSMKDFPMSEGILAYL
jgi:tetratricopeptide (TPR) repeat protein